MIAHATRLGATVVRAPGAVVIIIPDPTSRPDDLIPIDVVAQIAKTSVRVVKDAIRKRDLAAFGKERDRCVRRSDVDSWIESRRYAPIAGPDDAEVARWMAKRDREGPRDIDIRRRMQRIAREERAKVRQKPPSNLRK